MQPLNAILTCAGEGARLKQTPVTPKCLLPLVTGETIGERMIRQLNEVGVSDITLLVCGNEWRQKFTNEIKRVLGRKTTIREVIFPKQNTEDVYTFLSCKDLFHNTLMLAGDVVTTVDVLKEILSEPFEDIMFIISTPQGLSSKLNIKFNSSWREMFGFRVNSLGTQLLYNIPNAYEIKSGDYAKRVGTNKLLWEHHRMGHLMRESKIMDGKKRFAPKGFICDVDHDEEYKLINYHLKQGTIL